MTGEILFADVVSDGARHQPSRPALGGIGWSVSYAELDDRARRLGSLLHEEGVRAGDRVALLAPNCAEFIETVVGASLLGAAVVPLNVRLIAEELRFLIEDAGIAFAVVHADFLDVAVRAGITEHPHAVLGGEFASRRAGAARFAGVRPSARADLIQLYTSGTTGRPKGCLLPQASWLAASTSFAHGVGLRRSDVVVTQLPLFHVAGLLTALATLLVGGTVVLPPGADPVVAWRAAREHGGTAVQSVLPWSALLSSPEAIALAGGMRFLFGASAYHGVLEELDESVQVFSGYGSTEMCGFALIADRASLRARSGCVGRPLAGYATAIVDADGAALPSGGVGELIVRSASVTTGYWRLPDASREALRDGWYHSGDLFRAGPDGSLHFIDRLKDMVKSGGENVYCVEVEAALAAHPLVDDCAVIGVPDARWGEAVKAVIVSSVGVAAETLDAWCLDRLAPFKRPRLYEFVAELPRNATTKILQPTLRASHDRSRCVAIASRGGHASAVVTS